jgi:hypothetical protein
MQVRKNCCAQWVEGSSTFAQQQIHNPATANVLAGLAAVIQNVGVGAAGFFEGVGQDRQSVKCTLVINLLGQLSHNARFPYQPRWIKNHTAKSVTENVSEQLR